MAFVTWREDRTWEEKTTWKTSLSFSLIPGYVEVSFTNGEIIGEIGIDLMSRREKLQDT